MADFRNTLEKTFKSDTFPDDVTLTLELEDVVAQEVGKDKETKPVAYFKGEPRGLVLNVTNYKVLTKAHGNPDTDSWIGAKIELWKDPSITFGGKETGGLRVKVLTPAPKKS